MFLISDGASVGKGFVVHAITEYLRVLRCSNQNLSQSSFLLQHLLELNSYWNQWHNFTFYQEPFSVKIRQIQVTCKSEFFKRSPFLPISLIIMKKEIDKKIY